MGGDDDDSGFVIVTDEQHLESAEPTHEIELLRQQLAARDAALDAVLALADKWHFTAAGKQLTDLLLKHGVHPK